MQGPDLKFWLSPSVFDYSSKVAFPQVFLGHGTDPDDWPQLDPDTFGDRPAAMTALGAFSVLLHTL
jgi:hypothetical protein